jgi:hypothetical protein
MEAILNTLRTYAVTFQNGKTKTVKAYGISGAISKAIVGAYSPSQNRIVAVKELPRPVGKKTWDDEDDWREGLSDDKIGKLENMARDDMGME